MAKTCFGAAYIYALLHDALRIAPDQRRLIFANSVRRPPQHSSREASAGGGEGRHVGQARGTEDVGRVEVNWPLGAMLVEVAQAPLPFLAHLAHGAARAGHSHDGGLHQRQHQQERASNGTEGEVGLSDMSGLEGDRGAPGASARASATARVRAGTHASRPKQGGQHAAGRRGARRGSVDGVQPGALAGSAAGEAAAGAGHGLGVDDEVLAEQGGHAVGYIFAGQPFAMAVLLLLAVGAASALSISRSRPVATQLVAVVHGAGRGVAQDPACTPDLEDTQAGATQS